MKKLLFVPSLIGLLLINGCQTEGTETTQDSPVNSIVQATQADVEVGYLTFELMSPSGLEVVNPPLFLGIVGVAALVASGGEYFSHHRQTNTMATDGMIALPEKYLLANNPYEIVGIGHNRGLAELANLNRLVTVEDFKQDAFVSKLLKGFGSFTPAQQQQLLADIKQLQTDKGIYHTMMNQVNYVHSIGYDLNKLAFSSDYHKHYLQQFFAQVEQMEQGRDFKDRLYTKTNDAITALLAQERVDNRGLIVALTVFKHSYEYWY